MNNDSSIADQDLARERIDAALRYDDFCTCGAPMSAEVRDGTLWIECASLRTRHGLRLLISSGFHDRRRIDLPGSDYSIAA
jgi:hypothetical protein